MIDTSRVLQPLDEAEGSVRSLYHHRDTGELGAAIIAVDAALERSLRLLLRDDRDAPDSLRLAALSPAEVSFQQLLDALRRRDVISIELAGAAHQTRAAAGRARAGDVRPADADAVIRAVERLRADVSALALPAGSSPAEAGEPGPGVAPDVAVVAPSRRRRWTWLAVAIGAVVVLVGAYYLFSRPSAFDRGVEAFQQGREGVAEREFEAALQHDSSDVTTRLYLARILRGQERYREAADQLRAAAALAPRDPDVRRELGHLFFALKSYQSAAAEYRQALELQPDETMNWIGLIRSLRAAGDPQAEELLRSAPPAVQAALAPK